MSDVKWLMDVDGVLNHWDIHKYPEPTFKTFAASNGFTITYDHTVISRIVDLHESGAVEIRWLTTWQSQANVELREIFGFKENLVVEGGDCDMPYLEGWWKLPIAQKAVETYDRVIWIDDEVHTYTDTLQFIKTIEPNKLLTIAPRQYLTHKHIDKIEDWIKK